MPPLRETAEHLFCMEYYSKSPQIKASCFFKFYRKSVFFSGKHPGGKARRENPYVNSFPMPCFYRPAMLEYRKRDAARMEIPKRNTIIIKGSVSSMSSKVYFSKTITPEKVLELFKLLQKDLPGKTAIKVHSGEVGNQNFLRPDFWKPVVDFVDGTVTECNTAYDGERNTTEKHLKAISLHGWDEYFDFDLLDAEGPDLELDIPDGLQIKKNYVGKNLKKYDSLLVLSHFKGHPMGGYGGAIKQLSIGVASSFGKAYIHGAGNPDEIWTADHDSFLRSMADAAASVVEFFHGNAAYINVMKNMSVDCDCCAVAEDPCMKDIGILASLDPIAIDQACLDLVYAAKDDPGQAHLLERIESRNGVLTIEAAAKLGYGAREYELVEVE